MHRSTDASCGRGMDTDLVIRAQRGDKEAFALLASGFADRYLAVARRILRDLDLAEDATQQALLTIWQDLPQLRDPARFEAWSYRLLVRACYAEGRNNVAGHPTSACCRLTSRWRRMDSTPSWTAISSSAASDGSPRSPSGGGPAPLPRPAARPGRRHPRRPGRDGLLTTSLRDARAARGARCRRSPTPREAAQ